MKTEKSKILMNTVFLYVRLFVVIIVNLVTIPIILNELGVEDYGLYNLIGGIITMLSFLNSSMTVSTQRFLSVSLGDDNSKRTAEIFRISVVLHLVIGLLIICILEISGIFLFNGILNINNAQLKLAKQVYQLMIASTIIIVLSVPFDALLNAVEDLFAFSFFGILDALMKLILAILLGFMRYNKLRNYIFGILLSTLMIWLLKYLYLKIKFHDLLFQKIKNINKNLFRDILQFSGWNIYSSFARLARNSGTSIILNIFLGTTINASYGIANQLNGLLLNFSTSIQKAIEPQIMKAEAKNDLNSQLGLGNLLTKSSIFIYSIIAIPLLVAMPNVLQLWLHTVPRYTVWFCRLIIISSYIPMFTTGLVSIIYAKGRVKRYLLSIGSMLLLNLPAAYIILIYNYSVYFVIGLFIITELITTFVRFYLLRRYYAFDYKSYLRNVVFPNLIVICVTFCIIFYIPTIQILNIIIMVLISTSSIVYFSWKISLTNKERNAFKHLLINKLFARKEKI